MYRPEAGDLGNGPNVVPAWHSYWLVLGAIGKGDSVRNTDHVCKNAGARTWARMGSCVWCCWAGLLCCHGTVLCELSGALGGALGNSGARMHAEGLNRVGRTVYGCVYLYTQSALGRTGFRRHRRRDRRALLSMWETRTSEGTGGPEQKIEDRKCVGSGGALSAKGSGGFNTSLLLGHCNCLLLGCLWAQHLCYFRQGSTWTNTAPTRFNVGLLVEAGDGGGGALVPGSGSWTLFLFFSALWGKATSR